MSDERDLQSIDLGIRKLRVEYDLYLSGQRKRPPDDERRQLDGLMRRLSGVAWGSAADRFRYQSLLGRYNSYVELWEKQIRERDEGPRDPRKRRAALAPRVPAPVTASAENGAAPPAVPPAGSPAANAPPRRTVEIRVGGGGGDEAVRAIFDRYVAAREESGESGGTVSFDRFRRLIDDQSSALGRKTGSDTIEFEVKLADGKVKLVAKPKGRP